MTKGEALAKLVESRQALRQALQGFSEQAMAHIPVEGVWTVKDINRVIKA